MSNYYKEIELANWADYKNLAENSRLEWIFRGQSDSNWELQSSLERSMIMNSFPSFEEDILKEFNKGVRFYLDGEKAPSSILESLSMLQHFGAPSRLIDFTKSPYIAAFFAFEKASENTDKIAIWIVNKIYLYQSSVNFLNGKVHISSEHNMHTFDDQTFENAFDRSKSDELNCIFPVEPSSQNQRYHSQQSIFLSQGNPHEQLINQFDFIKPDILEQTFMKVTIPASERKTAIRDLIKMNLNRATLFPGLDGFAQSLLLKYGNLSNIQSTIDTLNYAKTIGLA